MGDQDFGEKLFQAIAAVGDDDDDDVIRLRHASSQWTPRMWYSHPTQTLPQRIMRPSGSDDLWSISQLVSPTMRRNNAGLSLPFGKDGPSQQNRFSIRLYPSSDLSAAPPSAPFQLDESRRSEWSSLRRLIVIEPPPQIGVHVLDKKFNGRPVIPNVAVACFFLLGE